MGQLLPEERKRYLRHFVLNEVGVEGQEKLKAAKVLVIGAGGLGSPVLLYLTAAGIGTIGIVDFDVVDESNLQRQILYATADIGKSKAPAAFDHLQALNPYVNFELFREKLTNNNALNIFNKYDIIVDGSDNFPTRYLVNDTCVILNKPWVFGSIYKFEGQVSVFNFQNGPSYRCLYPVPPKPGEVANCSEIGVIGVLPGIIGSFQANEVIKMVLSIGEVLSSKLLIFDALTMNQTQIKFKKQPVNFIIKELADYEIFCGLINDEQDEKTISPLLLKELLNKNEDIQLIDVREPWESAICTIEGAELIPLGSVGDKLALIDRHKKVVVYCHHGIRSAKAIQFLKENHSFTNLINLENGIHGWAQTVDEMMAQY